MSDDAKAAKDLVQTLKDGERGLTSVAEKLADSDRAELAPTFQKLAQQRATFSREIVDLGDDYGADVDASGSAAAAVHRGWTALKDAVTGDKAGPVLSAAATGEEHAVSEYEKALEDDLSDGFRAVVERQLTDIKAARDEVKTLTESA